MSYECMDLEEAAHRAAAVKPSSHGCKECLESGDEWVHLRLCLTCGHVGCCDNSKNHHATKHARASHHPVIRSFEPSENWAYCYRDDAIVESFPAKSGEAATEHYSAP
ncbi:MAG: UBP-type zinc finger domain-containing protein [Myxococcaceae bacterium]